jgi:hypothetical protein
VIFSQCGLFSIVRAELLHWPDFVSSELIGPEVYAATRDFGVSCAATSVDERELFNFVEVKCMPVDSCWVFTLTLSPHLGPCGWDAIFNVSVSISIPFGVGAVYIAPVQGNLSPDLAEQVLTSALGGVLLLPGSQLAGMFTWTQREMIETAAWGVSSVRVAINHHLPTVEF